MIKKLILPCVLLMALTMAPSCNSSVESYEYTYSTSVQVTAFSLAQNDSVLDSLQNVFFSIDLANGQIFNADSLPYGTNISRLVTSVSAVSTASAVTIKYRMDTGADSVVDYLTNSGDSIDFSNGPAILTVTSQSGTVTKDYTVKVNVHQTKPDTLAWSSIESALLPSAFVYLDAQKAVQMQDVCYLLSKGDGQYCLATTSNPYNPQWEEEILALPFDADVESLVASDNSLWMLDSDGNLFSSSDGANWLATGVVMSNLYGGYADQVIGCVLDSEGTWKIMQYPSKESWVMPEGFPVKGASNVAILSSSMINNPQLLMVGGIDASGNYLNVSWAFDGENWAKISRANLPRALQKISLVAYDLFYVPSTTWSPVQYPALLAFGGMNADGINRIVYMSKDWGMTWTKAPETIQLPAELPTLYGSSPIVHSTTMHVSRSALSSAWTPVAIPSLWPQCQFVTPEANSRVTAPITEWECPAIYMLGGRDYQGKYYNSVWRGVVLRYTFKPVY